MRFHSYFLNFAIIRVESKVKELVKDLEQSERDRLQLKTE